MSKSSAVKKTTTTNQQINLFFYHLLSLFLFFFLESYLLKKNFCTYLMVRQNVVFICFPCGDICLHSSDSVDLFFCSHPDINSHTFITMLNAEIWPVTQMYTLFWCTRIHDPYSPQGGNRWFGKLPWLCPPDSASPSQLKRGLDLCQWWLNCCC